MSLSSHQRDTVVGINDEWLTPPEIVDAVGPFDLDPCAPINRPWDTAAHHYTLVDDGLSQPWFGRVWLNPPFGRKEPEKWIKRMVEHNCGTLLFPARTETRLFQDFIFPFATEIFFLKGRPHFHYLDGSRAKFNSGAPICLVGYGGSIENRGLEGALTEIKT